MTEGLLEKNYRKIIENVITKINDDFEWHDKKFLKDNNIVELDKSSKPILVNGDDKIIWIVGMRLDDRFSISDESKNLLNIEYHE